jgi:hypothetical protein
MKQLKSFLNYQLKNPRKEYNLLTIQSEGEVLISQTSPGILSVSGSRSRNQENLCRKETLLLMKIGLSLKNFLSVYLCIPET